LAQAEACNELAGMYVGHGEIKRDPGQALRLYEKSCYILEDGGGCFNLALLYSGGGLEVHEDKAKSVELARRSCDLEEAAGCAELGSDYRFGRGVAKDEKRAVELFNRSCAMGSQVGCSYLKGKTP
jgi:TPR repeat protein